MPITESYSISLSDVQASRIAVDASGQYGALSGSVDLCVLSLDNPSVVHRHPLNLKSDPTGLSWHPTDPSLLVVARFNRCELLHWDPLSGTLKNSQYIGGYVRPITSLDWSPLQPHLLSTSSTDQFRAICIWDVRDLCRPVRAIESLSDPSIIRWSRMSSHCFATLHRSGIRLWDLRSNIPEPYLTDQTSDSKGRGPSISDFNWSPSSAYELSSIDQRGTLCVWDVRQPNSPKDRFRSAYSHNAKVFYSPSGSHILTLSEPSHWKNVGFNVWNANNLKQPAPPLWKPDPISGAIVQPSPTEPAVRGIAWRTRSNFDSTYAQKLAEEEEEHGFFRGDDLDDAYDSRTEIGFSLELLTWAEDHVIRRYPILSPQPSSNQREAGSTPGIHAKQPVATRVTTHSSSQEPCPTDQRGSFAKRPFGFGRIKHTDGGQSKVDDSGTRFSATKLLTASTPEAVESPDEGTYRMLAQELSLLSPRTGQYKVEEIDMINRNAKLKIFYCRKLHYHHYSVCSASADVRGRRPSAELEEVRDLDCLLLPPGDMLPVLDGPLRLDQQWKSPEQCKSANDLHNISTADERKHQDPQQAVVEPLSTQPGPTRPISTQTPKTLSGTSWNDFNIPVAGSVTISVSFPLDYPRSTPKFTILYHYPAVPTELVSHLHEVLQTTASELVRNGRGCMEPCMRKAIELLQNIPSNRLSYPNRKASDDSYDMSRPHGLNDVQGTNYGSPPVQSLKSLVSDPEDQHLSRTPFPRTSGVHFSTQGFLVAFGLPLPLSALRTQIRSTAPTSLADTVDWTPRSYKDYRSMMATSMRTSKVSVDTSSTTSGITDTKHLEETGQRTDYLLTENDIFTDVEWAQNSFNLPSTESQTILNHHSQECLVPGVLADKRPLGNGLLNKNDSDLLGASMVSTSQVDEERAALVYRGPPHLGTTRIRQCYQSVVQLYDLSSWILQKKLIRNYSLSTDNVQNMCAHNYIVALNTGRKDIQRFWQYTVVLTASMTKFSLGTLPPLSVQPVGKLLFNEWLSHFLRLSDVQHLAMAILVLLGLDILYGRTPSLGKLSSLRPSFISLRRNAYPISATPGQLPRSSSDLKPYEKTDQESFEHGKDQDDFYSGSESSEPVFSPVAPEVSFNLDDSQEGTPVAEAPINQLASRASLLYTQNSIVADSYYQHWSFIASEELPCFAHYISTYADILYSMGSFLRHTRLLRAWTDGLKTRWPLKNITYSSATQQPKWPRIPTEVALIPSCPKCGSSVSRSEIDGSEQRLQCQMCSCSAEQTTSEHRYLSMNHRTSLRCSICRLQAKGLVFICPRCHHGGHMDHLFQWFSTRPSDGCLRQCPSINCTCSCALCFDSGNTETYISA